MWVTTWSNNVLTKLYHQQSLSARRDIVHNYIPLYHRKGQPSTIKTSSRAPRLTIMGDHHIPTLGVEWTLKCANPILSKGFNVPHITTQCAKLSTIMSTNSTSSDTKWKSCTPVYLEGTNVSNHPTSSVSPKGTDDNQLHIVTSSLSG